MRPAAFEFLTTVTCLSCLLLCINPAHSSKRQNGLIVDTTIDINGRIAAFGDFNGDKFTDIFVLNHDQTKLNIHVWDHESQSFLQLQNAIIDTTSPSFPKKMTITNVVPSDYNYDGSLDVLLMGQTDPVSQPNGEVFMHIAIGNGLDGFNSTLELPSSSSIQPTLLDYDGTMSMDLLGYPSSSQSQLSLWKNTATPLQSSSSQPSLSQLFELQPIPPPSPVPFCQISSFHSNAFVDLNGDCLSDIFLTCADGQKLSYQIWINNKTEFKMLKSGSLPTGTGPISFTDVNSDGTIDLVFPVCESSDNCKIHIVYNKQMPVCAHESTFGSVTPGDGNARSGKCRDISNLCVPDDDFILDFGGKNGRVIIDLNEPLGLDGEKKKKIITEWSEKSGVTMGKQPAPIRIGDFNLDGYPDFLILTAPSSSSGTIPSPTSLELLQSGPCINPRCSVEDSSVETRDFQIVQHGVGALRSVGGDDKMDIIQAAFFDVDEDGTLDILVTVYNKADKSMRTRAILNQFYNDAFFLKTLALNGVDPNRAANQYGVNYVGANFKYTVIDTKGRKRAVQVAQLPQTSYMSLHTPYTLFGLGRTNNYIEELFIGVTRNQSLHYLTYQSVIPNSQLIIIPYQPTSFSPANFDPSSTWKLELYINPSTYALQVLISLIGSVTVFSFVVLVLQWFEKREDERERKRVLHSINFDAL
ncbi:hypothetical protein BKA69DRAFT_811638 [Paraphysoderma sedebokerense]|nr:hypothetical protein BKA69DRAFT_811638 [Paraphysoderma sedebokerense]